MSKFTKLGNIAKVLGISAAAGMVGARMASTPHEADKNGRFGAIASTVVAAAALSIPPLTKIVFRRIRGRIIPIRAKK